MTARVTVCASSTAAAEGLVVVDGTRISLRQVGAEDRAGMAACSPASPRNRATSASFRPSAS
jgi:hypothetical protein